MTNNFLRVEKAWDCTEQSEIMLVRSAQSGNLEAFNALVLKYQDLIYGVVLRILGQDATQEAIISAYQHIVNFRGGSLKAWLMRILINRCYDDIRRMQRTSAISLNEGLTDDGENQNLYSRFQNHVPSVEECVEDSEKMSISKNAWENCRPITASSSSLWILRRCLMARRPPS